MQRFTKGQVVVPVSIEMASSAEESVALAETTEEASQSALCVWCYIVCCPLLSLVEVPRWRKNRVRMYVCVRMSVCVCVCVMCV